MNTNDVLRFLGWRLLTYMWLDTNRLFFFAIVDAINEHNEQIRQKAIEEYEDASKTGIETETEVIVIENTNEDVSEDKSEDE